MSLDDNRALVDIGINILFKIINIGVENYDLCCITIFNKCTNVNSINQSMQIEPSSESESQKQIVQHPPRRRENSAPSIEAVIKSLEDLMTQNFMEEEWMEDRKSWKRLYRNS